MVGQNYFDNQLSVQRYAAARPNVHDVALAAFLAFSRSDLPFQQVLDVGCGTGHSTVALSGLARHVVGIDVSDAMLEVCEARSNVEFQRSPAESVPARAGVFDLVVAAQAFHWFDQDAFLSEACRVLAPAGWLLIYTAGFTATMKENDAFHSWFTEEYLSRYPTPLRRGTAVTPDMAQQHGLTFRGEDSFAVEVPMTIRRFTDYELSTSNVIAAVGDDPHAFDKAEHWISDSIRPFFSGATERTFLFSGRNWYLQKAA